MPGIARLDGSQSVAGETIDIDLGRTQIVTDAEGQPVIDEATKIPQQVPVHFKALIPDEPMQGGEFVLLNTMTKMLAELLREQVFLRGQVMLMSQIMQQQMQAQAQKPQILPYEPKGQQIKVMRAPGPNSANGRHRNGR